MYITVGVPFAIIGAGELGTTLYSSFHFYKDGWHWGKLGYHTIGKTVAKSHGYYSGKYLHLNIYERHLILGKNLWKSIRYFRFKK